MEELTAEVVRVAYNLFFGRAPESEDMVRYALSFGTLPRLREAFLNSLEFEMLLNRWPRLVRADAPRLALEWRVDESAARALLRRLRAAWAATPPGLPADAGAIRDPSGEIEAAELRACLDRADLDPAVPREHFVFGCASLRVARHLPRATGCDLSPLRLAAGAREGAFTLVSDLRLGMTRGFDIWYSHLTLQSYPPPLIARILARAFALLRPGGAAVFQLPTYAYGYQFDPLASPRADPMDDRHVLPQAVVFTLAAEAGCTPAEAFDDLSVTPNPLWRSTIFVIRKAG
jgi:SAM-dependent methyltransferase